MCQPGGFENFFDESAKGMMDKMSATQMEAIMAKYGMETLGHRCLLLLLDPASRYQKVYLENLPSG